MGAKFIFLVILIMNCAYKPSQCKDKRITEIRIRMLPCFVDYDEVISLDNILKYNAKIDTMLIDKKLRLSIHKFINEYDYSEELEHVLDSRVYIECIYNNGKKTIILMDYYGRFSVDGKNYVKNNKLIEIISSTMPEFLECLE